MAYSTVEEFRNNVPRVNVDAMTDILVDDKIAQAEQIIKTDFGKIIDFVVVDALPTTPSVINLLSEHKTAEMCCVSKFGAKRMVEEQSDRQYWERLYNDKKKDILAGKVDIGAFDLGQVEFEHDVKEDITPALGMGEYGGHIDEDDREEQVDEFGGN